MNYKIWLKISSILMILTGLIHSISLFESYIPVNETEIMLLNLADNYKFDMGNGIVNTYNDHLIAFSICFTIFLLSSGLTLFYLTSKISDLKVLLGATWIYLTAFMGCFISMFLFTFLPPIICAGAIFLALCVSISLLLLSKKSAKTTNL
jgi:hypothetical protein